jgi:hypothetical protein
MVTKYLKVDLREAILQIARHFQSLDPKNNKVVSKDIYLDSVLVYFLFTGYMYALSMFYNG